MINAYALTDVGKMRNTNQDYVYCTSKPVGKLPNLYIVADGMGGHQAGDLASRFSVQSFIVAVRNSTQDNPITVIMDAIKYAPIPSLFRWRQPRLIIWEWEQQWWWLPL